MSDSGRLETIWIKRAKREPMIRVEKASAKAGSGLEGNADQGGKRQVTIVSVESWADAAAEVAGDPEPILRRANLLVSGVDLVESRGKTLRVGELEIEIHGNTKPCRRMEESHTGLQEALTPEWRAGAYGVVLRDADIKLGDEVTWAE